MKAWRKVIRAELYANKCCPISARGTFKFTLECGHIAFAKASGGIPAKKVCRDCQTIENVCKRLHPCGS